MKNSLKNVAMGVFLAATGLSVAGCEKKAAPEEPLRLVQLADGEIGAISSCGNKEIEKTLNEIGKKDTEVTVELQESGKTVTDKKTGEKYPVICVTKIERPGISL